MNYTNLPNLPPTSAPLGVRRGVEKPRPLKCAPSLSIPNSPVVRPNISSVEEVMTLFENVCDQLNQGNYQSQVISAIISLNAALKIFGHQAEVLFKDQVDKLQSFLRNACRDSRLDLVGRIHILEIIELRAMQWVHNEKVAAYYRKKLAELENPSGNPSSAQATSLNANAPDFTPSYLQSPDCGILIPAVPSGQVLIPIEKFEKQAKVLGKNNFKEEVVIRNSDSGKVMGIKGKRVHIIEELSDTVISFQRVAVGARERLVQISGPDEGKINQAKNLIEETIRRNQSPDFNEGFGTETGGKHSGLTSPNLSNTFIGEYKYTVNIGDERIKIYGSNANLVRTAKIVLDDYFGEHKLSSQDLVAESDEKAQKVPEKSPPADRKSTLMLKVVRQPLFPASTPEAFLQVENNSVREADKCAKERRANFAKTNSNLSFLEHNNNNNIIVNNNNTNVDNNNSTSVNNSNKLEGNRVEKPALENKKDTVRYDRDFLLKCSKSSQSHKFPECWHKILEEFPQLERKVSDHDPATIVDHLSPKPRRQISFNNNNNLLFEKARSSLIDPRPDAPLKTWDAENNQWVDQGAPTRA